MEWVILIASGVLEAVWATALGASKNFRRLWPTVIFVVALALSMWGLAFAMTAIPVGTAYAVWVGIGAVGTVLFGIVVRGEPTSPANLAALSLLVLSIVAVKLTAAH
jgi:quaternary ammonium compound-resistance protein SugE